MYIVHTIYNTYKEFYIKDQHKKRLLMSVQELFYRVKILGLH